MINELTVMTKSANVEFKVADLIKHRKSSRAFSTKLVEPEKINSLFEAARWSASSMNEQPWQYLFATREQPELWNKFFSVLNEGNRTWAQHVPLLIFSVTRKIFKRFNSPNAYTLYDLGAANTLLSLQAVDLGLQVRQMAGYDHQKAREVFNVPDDFELGVMMAVGYPAPIEEMPEEIRVKELAVRERLLQEHFVKNGIF
jgi:nitroreductase